MAIGNMMLGKMNDKIMSKLDNELNKSMKELTKYLEDIAESQDQMTKAIISLYNNQVAIAKELNVKLPKPIVDMTIDEGNLTATDKKIVEGVVVDDDEN